MIRIKEAYRLLRRNKRKSIITITKIFIPAEIANSIVKRMYFLFFILEFTYSTTLIICFAFFAQHVMFPVLFVQFSFLSFVERALYAYFFIIIIIIIYFFVREEKRNEIDLVDDLLKLQATRGLPIKRPRRRVGDTNMMQSRL